MNLRYVSIALTSIALFIGTGLPAAAASPFEYKAYRPGVTTLAEFRQRNKSIFDKYPPRNAVSDIDHNIYETNFQIICNRPVKAGSYILDLTYCDNYRQDESEVTLSWDFTSGVLAYVDVYFPTDQCNDTLALLETKYGKASALSKGTTRMENGEMVPYVKRSWKTPGHMMELRTVSATDAAEASLEVSDDALYHRYLSATSKAEI